MHYTLTKLDSMPRKSSEIESVPFHGVWDPSSAVSQELLNLNPTNMAAAGFTRLASVADNYASFRIKSLRFRLHPLIVTATSDAAVCFTGAVQDTSPTSVAQVMEVLPSLLMVMYRTTPTEWKEVPKADLCGPLPWYKSLLGTADPTEESPGLIVLVKAATALMGPSVEIEGVYEFRSAIAPANTPMLLKLQAEVAAARRTAVIQREREALLRVLAPSPSTGKTPGA